MSPPPGIEEDIEYLEAARERRRAKAAETGEIDDETESWLAEEALERRREEEVEAWISTRRRALAAWADPDLSLVGRDQLAPPFPTNAVPSSIIDWIEDEAAGRAAPADYVYSSLLASGSAWLGNARRVQASGAWIEQPHLWFMNIGAPSSGKTPAQTVFPEISRELEKIERIPYLAKRVAYLKRKENKELAEGEQPPPEPRVIVSDITTEKIAPILADNPKGILVYRDELSGWIGSFDAYRKGSNKDLNFFLEGYNGGPYTVDRVKNPEPVHIPYNSLAIFGGIQPDRVRGVLGGENSGFVARFLLIWPEHPPYQPLKKDPDALKRRARLLSAATRLHGLTMNDGAEFEPVPHCVALHRDALALFEKYRERIHDDAIRAREPLQGWIGKNGGRVLRLALVMHHLEWAMGDEGTPPTEIGEESMSTAIVYLDYAEKMFERVVGGVTASVEEEDAAALARHIRTTGMKALRETGQDGVGRIKGLRGLRDAKRRKAVLTALAERGWIRRGEGRGSWEVNALCVSSGKE
jgi:hypothetical protein